MKQRHEDMDLSHPGLSESEEPVYTEDERQRDRSELIKQLRAKIKSGSYEPSIGRISMNIFSDIAGD
ncbi:MAG: flagellar biosynthesis anti-sigma factor FlgM [Proteobacteria bacterium]|nr:flagellar biosynthesis anti-sigma factor FlgM [Pseudomonadota bacterium]